MSLLLLVSAAVTAASADATAAPQAELATLLASATSIDRVEARANGVAFAIERDGETYQLLATTRGAEVVAVVVADLGRAVPHAAGRFTWLAGELAGRTSITTLAVDASCTVIATTGAGTRYAVIAGEDGNSAVAARWAASWDDSSDD